MQENLNRCPIIKFVHKSNYLQSTIFILSWLSNQKQAIPVPWCWGGRAGCWCPRCWGWACPPGTGWTGWARTTVLLPTPGLASSSDPCLVPSCASWTSAKVLVGWHGGDPFWSDDFWVYWLTNFAANWNFGHGSWFRFVVLRAGPSLCLQFQL